MIAKKPQKTTTFYRVITRPIPVDRQLGKIYYADKKDEEDRYEHEKATARILIRFGSDVRFIKANNKPKMLGGPGNPDCWWRGEKWELKSPTGDKESTIPSLMKGISKQSKNIIIDTSRSKRRGFEQIARDVMKYLDERSRGPMRKTVIVLNQEKYCLIGRDMIL